MSESDETRPPEIWWEIVKSIRSENPKVQGTVKPNIRRAPVPGGWILELENTTFIFVPDVNHEWKTGAAS